MGIKLSHNKCGASEFVLIDEEKIHCANCVSYVLTKEIHRHNLASRRSAKRKTFTLYQQMDGKRLQKTVCAT